MARCLELIAPERAEIALAGAGAGHDLWRRVLAAVTGLPVVRRAVDDAASVGARSIVATALDEPFDVDAVNPVVDREQPDPSLVEAYRPVRAAVRRGRRSGARRIHCCADCRSAQVTAH